jgi:hypothetical protein
MLVKNKMDYKYIRNLVILKSLEDIKNEFEIDLSKEYKNLYYSKGKDLIHFITFKYFILLKRRNELEFLKFRYTQDYMYYELLLENEIIKSDNIDFDDYEKQKTIYKDLQIKYCVDNNIKIKYE